MRQLILLCYTIVLFSLITFILVYFNLFFTPSLNDDQTIIIAMFSFFGYAACALAFYVWYNEYQTKKKKNIQRF